MARKLGIATALMFTLPFIVFYICLSFVFTDKEEPAAWSGGMAVVTANVVVAGYVISAFSEEDDMDKTPSEGDADGPRVGAFKTRTD